LATDQGWGVVSWETEKKKKKRDQGLPETGNQTVEKKNEIRTESLAETPRDDWTPVRKK